MKKIKKYSKDQKPRLSFQVHSQILSPASVTFSDTVSSLRFLHCRQGEKEEVEED